MSTIGTQDASSRGAEQLNPLTAYIPRIRRPRLAAADPNLPGVTSRQAILLLADVVEFTAITDQLMELGVSGAEHLANALGDHVSRLIGLAEQHGGEFLGLAGDALRIAWLVDDNLRSADAAALAVRAALEFQANTTSRAPTQPDIAFRIGLGYGSLEHHEVGGLSDGWHGVFTGSSFDEAVATAEVATRNEVVVSSTLAALLKGRSQGSLIADGIFRVTSVDASDRQHFTSQSDIPIPTKILEGSSPREVVGQRLAGHYGRSFGEFRQLSVAFFELRHPPYSNPTDLLDALQQATLSVQRCVHEREGTLHQVRADEAGITIIAVFGLPFTHEDDAERSIMAALQLHREWGNLRLTDSAGIASGRAFCTTVGTESSRTFAIFGPVMNLAARLMQKRSGIVCDYATFVAGKRRNVFSARELSPQKIKGKRGLLNLYSPYIDAGEGLRFGWHQHLVGRAYERQLLHGAVQNVLSRRSSSVFIEGEPGVGKTALIEHVITDIKNRDFVYLVASNSGGPQVSAYAAWVRPFRILFGLHDRSGETSTQQTRSVMSHLGDDEMLAPLLAGALGLAISESPATLKLTGEGRAAMTRRLLLERIAAASRDRLLAIVLDDIHWFDSASLTLLQELVAADLPILLLIASRSRSGHQEQINRIKAHIGLRYMALEGLPQDSMSLMIAETMQADACSQEAARFVFERSAGNPLFATQLIEIMRGNGLLNVLSGEVDLPALAISVEHRLQEVLRSKGLPSTLEGLVRARLDQLGGRQWSLLKSASVVGTAFSIAMIPDGHPPGLRKASLARSLVRNGFLRSDTEPDGFRFCHSLVRDVVYHSMSFAERKALHLAFAEELEESAAARDGLVDALLGHHFEHAGVPLLAVKYLIRSARAALSEFANTEAYDSASKALNLLHRAADTTASLESPREAEAELELLLGDAAHKLSLYKEARHHAQVGLALRSMPVPRTSATFLIAALDQVVRQVFHRLVPFVFRAPPPLTQTHLGEAASTLEYLGEVYFLAGDQLASLYAAVRMLNLSERARKPALMAFGYASLALVATALSLRKVSLAYSKRALSTLRQVDNAHSKIMTLSLVAGCSIAMARWHRSLTHLNQAALLARNSEDRRLWRATVELRGLTKAAMGQWRSSLDDMTAMLESAEQDKDRRAMISARRALAISFLHLNQLDVAEIHSHFVQNEIHAGVTAEELPTRQDNLAARATLALERGDPEAAAALAHQALDVIERNRGGFAFEYCAMFLVARVFHRVTAYEEHATVRARRPLRRIWQALRKQGRSYYVARPSALLAGASYYQSIGQVARSVRLLTKCNSLAQTLNMPYERALATTALDHIRNELHSVDVLGLSFFGQSNDLAK